MKFSYRLNHLRCLLLVPLFQARAQRTPIYPRGRGELGERPKGGDAVGLRAAIQFLPPMGMDKYVDTYGVHFYPQGNATPAERLSSLQRDFAECGSGGAAQNHAGSRNGDCLSIPANPALPTTTTE